MKKNAAKRGAFDAERGLAHDRKHLLPKQVEMETGMTAEGNVHRGRGGLVLTCETGSVVHRNLHPVDLAMVVREGMHWAHDQLREHYRDRLDNQDLARHYDQYYENRLVCRCG